MRVFDFLQYYWYARTKYQIDSPFVFDFINHVLTSPVDTPYKSDFQSIRATLLQDHSKINLEPLGAESKVLNGRKTTISRVARSSLTLPSQQALLYRLVKHYRPKYLLELGTNFGLTTALQQLANPDGLLISIEGQPQIFQQAMEIHRNFKHFNNRPRLLLGSFEQQLPQALAQFPRLDYLFIDGDHRFEAVVSNYLMCKEHLTHESVVVIHDIYWSAGMKAAWNKIKVRSEVKVAIDLFHCGILFFSEDVKEPLDLKLITSKWKPLSWGFFR